MPACNNNICTAVSVVWGALCPWLNAFSDIGFINFLQEKQRRLIGGPSSGKVVNISEKSRRQTQVYSLLIASCLLFVFSQV